MSSLFSGPFASHQTMNKYICIYLCMYIWCGIMLRCAVRCVLRSRYRTLNDCCVYILCFIHSIHLFSRFSSSCVEQVWLCLSRIYIYIYLLYCLFACYLRYIHSLNNTHFIHRRRHRHTREYIIYQCTVGIWTCICVKIIHTFTHTNSAGAHTHAHIGVWIYTGTNTTQSIQHWPGGFAVEPTIQLAAVYICMRVRLLPVRFAEHKVIHNESGSQRWWGSSCTM